MEYCDLQMEELNIPLIKDLLDLQMTGKVKDKSDLTEEILEQVDEDKVLRTSSNWKTVLSETVEGES